MNLVCPVGDPPGIGTKYCRLCGRDYVEASDAAALKAGVTVQAVERLELPMLVMAGSAGAEQLNEESFDLERFALRMADGTEAPFIPAQSAPVDEVVPQEEPTPLAVSASVLAAASAAASADIEDALEVPRSKVQRRLLVLVAGVACVGGLLAGAGAVAGLG